MKEEGWGVLEFSEDRLKEDNDRQVSDDERTLELIKKEANMRE